MTKLNFVGSKSLEDFNLKTDPKQPFADVTNASMLMGDPGDEEEGDIDEFGDVEEFGDAFYGDADTETGDAFYGDAVRRKSRKLSNLARQRRRLRHPKRSSLNQNLPFLECNGGTVVGAPLDTMASLPADSLKLAMDLQALQTPFYQITTTGTVAGNLINFSIQGALAITYYHAVFLSIGSNQFQGVPGIAFAVTGTFPLFGGGTLTVSSEPWAIKYAGSGGKFYTKWLLRSPWTLVSNKPVPTLGALSSTNPLTISISGLDVTVSSAVITIPGSLHPYTVNSRGAFARSLR